MTTVKNPPSPDGTYTGRCSLCSNDSAAAWMGSTGNIELCHSCVEKVCPALLADGLSYLSLVHMQGAAQRFEARFYRAFAHRLLRERDAAIAIEIDNRLDLVEKKPAT